MHSLQTRVFVFHEMSLLDRVQEPMQEGVPILFYLPREFAFHAVE
jgi:hypothetical protein